MIKLKKVAAFDPNSNRMKVIADVEEAIKEFQKKKNKNLDFLLKNRFSWMKKFISTNDKGLEVGAGAGFSKNYIKNKNFKISDLAMHDHLDLKNLDAQNTKLDPESYDFVIAVNMLHHVPYPIKFLNEMFKILKPGDKISVIIDQYDEEGKLLYASQDGSRIELNNKNLFLSYLKHPLMTFKIIAAIHFEAFKLWLKGIKFIKKKLKIKNNISLEN